jgi:hypothetical protein
MKLMLRWYGLKNSGVFRYFESLLRSDIRVLCVKTILRVAVKDHGERLVAGMVLYFKLAIGLYKSARLSTIVVLVGHQLT